MFQRVSFGRVSFWRVFVESCLGKSSLGKSRLGKSCLGDFCEFFGDFSDTWSFWESAGKFHGAASSLSSRFWPVCSWFFSKFLSWFIVIFTGFSDLWVFTLRYFAGFSGQSVSFFSCFSLRYGSRFSSGFWLILAIFLKLHRILPIFLRNSRTISDLIYEGSMEKWLMMFESCMVLARSFWSELETLKLKVPMSGSFLVL